MTLRAVPSLLAYLARAISWVPLLLVAPAAPVLAGLAWLSGLSGEDGLRPDIAIGLLRAGGLLLGAGAAFVLADDLAGSTAAVPSPRWLRQWLRTALALGCAAAAWAASYAVVAVLAADPLPPLVDTALPAAGCVLVGLAVAAIAVRRLPDRYGASTGGALLAILFVTFLFVPVHMSPWPASGAPSWDPVHTGWLLASLGSLATLTLAHHDPR